MNVFTAIGRIGRDAVTRHTQGGKAVTGWALAVDKGWGDNKQTVWIDCSLWGERGEKVAGYIKKGDRLGVTGELGTREHDGKTYVTLDVREVTLLAASNQNGEPVRANNAPRAAAAPRPQRQAAGSSEFADDDIPF
jgi:single-strand DNA-binding protein